ncbi:ribonuclease HIII [Mycoplasmopsis adleri]|uniref:ribonuclease HIII n=1 Tax=Mycoplasmopsis adleri TaxID=51362 RepID=UPI003873BEF5
MKFIEYNFSINLKEKNIIGIDEAGVGDYFGPLCSAAVLIPYQNVNKVVALGVKDSKKLTDKAVREIAEKLKSSGLIMYSIHHLTPKGYNSLNKKYNANVLKMFTHLNSFTNLEKKLTSYDYVFIDQYANKTSIEKYYEELIYANNWAKLTEINSEILLAHNAESVCPSVAAASVLARAEFLSLMDEMNEKYHIEFPFGSSKKVKEFAKKFFDKHNNDPNLINEVCKSSFKMKINDDDTGCYKLFSD